MKKVFAAVLTVAIYAVVIHQSHAQDVSTAGAPPQSVAIVLKFTGKNGIPESFQVYGKNTFMGKVKNLQANRDRGNGDGYRLKFFDGNEKLLHAEDIGNPLKEQLEAFNPDGTMEQNQVESETGYANIRFEIPDKLKTMHVTLSKNSGDGENIIATLNLSIQ